MRAVLAASRNGASEVRSPVVGLQERRHPLGNAPRRPRRCEINKRESPKHTSMTTMGHRFDQTNGPFTSGYDYLGPGLSPTKSDAQN
jgi:hypothetical protein